MPRDNFSQKTINTLRARVAHRCSNPICRVPTSAPAEAEKINSIGVAAHIYAASKGGPRADETLTSNERKSISNAIWLCSNCSIDIDRDADRYPPKLLEQWRCQAENMARSELGRKLPSNNDAIDTVTAALTGIPKNVIANAISNVHKATQMSLSQLDPRFHIETQYIDGKTSVGIYAKENVPLALKVRAEDTNAYVEKHRMLIEHGSDVQISTSGLTIEGSDLFDEMLKDGGTLSISAPKKKATQKLWLVQEDTNLVESFDDIQGELSIGTKSITFNGSACNGIFNLNYQKIITDGNQINITMSLSTNSWVGMDIRHLPYFNKIFSFFDKMADGWTLSTSLEVEGLNILNSIGMKVSTWEYVKDTSNFLYYVNRCQAIAKEFDFQVDYTPEVSFTTDEHMSIADVVDIIEEKNVYDAENLTENASCTIVADDKCKNIEMLADLKDPITIRMTQEVGEAIKLFNAEFNLPPQTIYITGVLPEFQGDVKNFKPDDAIKIEWLPQEDFKLLISYKSISA